MSGALSLPLSLSIYTDMYIHMCVGARVCACAMLMSVWGLRLRA